MRFSTMAEDLKPSDIREILKLTENPEVISFAGGVPDPDLFPIDEMKEVTQIVLKEMGKKALQYNSTEGYIPLREKIASRMNKAGMKTRADNILIISGSQQGLDFSGKLFLDKGDAVVCESPSYAGAISAFKAYEPEFIAISSDKHGMKLAELEETLQARNSIKMIYVIPNFQNPTGRSWSLECRRKFMELICHYDIPVIEDDPYGEICFDNKSLPSLKSLDLEGHVVYLGTFSKTFCPGLRVGWLEAGSQILQKYNIIKQSSDIHTNSLAQAEINKYLELYDFDKHIAAINKIYKGRRDLMVKSIKKHFPANISYTYPEGGLFIWVEMPEIINSRTVLAQALLNNVAFIPGETFYPCGTTTNTFRLNFSNVKESMIEIGIERLGKVLKDLN